MEILLETLIDNLKLFPFLLATYLLLEYMEHKTSDKVVGFLQRAHKSGPFVGSLCGALPQCGFSVVAANFYAVRIISLGTLLAVFLSTSDEMLPIFISQGLPCSFVLAIIGYKIVWGIGCGYAINFVGKKYTNPQPVDIETLCQQEHCHCEKGILISALEHSVHITIFILVVSLLINFLVANINPDLLRQYLQMPLVGELISGLIGLIPNCSASVILTQLYLDKYIGVSTLLSGTLAGGGVGVLVLFRVNRCLRENLWIVLLLYICGICGGLCSYLLWR